MGHYTSKLVFKNSGGGSGSGGSGGGGNGSHPKLSKAEKQLFRQLKSLENDVEAQVTDLIVPPLPLYVENRPVAPIAFVSSVAELLEGPDAEVRDTNAPLALSRCLTNNRPRRCVWVRVRVRFSPRSMRHR